MQDGNEGLYRLHDLHVAGLRGINFGEERRRHKQLRRQRKSEHVRETNLNPINAYLPLSVMLEKFHRGSAASKTQCAGRAFQGSRTRSAPRRQHKLGHDTSVNVEPMNACLRLSACCHAVSCCQKRSKDLYATHDHWWLTKVPYVNLRVVFDEDFASQDGALHATHWT